MTQQDRDRLVALKKAKKGLITQRQAAEEIGQSERHVRRLLKQLKGKGDGRWCMLCGAGDPTASWTRRRSRRRWRSWAARSIAGFGPTLAAEYLAEQTRHSCRARDGADWMIEGKLWQASRQRVEKIHQWRQRRSRVGELVQWDTSEHAWLEERGPKLYLISMIDDASSRLHARFVLHDSTEENMRLLWSYLERLRPAGQLLHRQGGAVSNGAEDRAGSKELPRDERDPLPPTQIGRALAELDMVWIGAHSPQAKAYASHCTSCEPWKTFSGKRRRLASLTPWALHGGLGPGSSYNQSSRSFTG